MMTHNYCLRGEKAGPGNCPSVNTRRCNPCNADVKGGRVRDVFSAFIGSVIVC